MKLHVSTRLKFEVKVGSVLEDEPGVLDLAFENRHADAAYLASGFNRTQEFKIC